MLTQVRLVNSASTREFDGRVPEFSVGVALLLLVVMLLPQVAYYGPIKTRHITELSTFDVLRVVDPAVFRQDVTSPMR